VSAPLPPQVRARVVALAAECLGSLGEEQVPSSVRPFRRFAPRRRAQAAAAPLAAALEQDPAFRQLVSEAVPEALAAAVRSGALPPAAPPEELACAAYLLRPDGWEAVVEAAGAELAERDRVAAGAATVDEVRRLTEQLEALRTAGREEAERLGAERDTARTEAAAAVRRAREAGSRAAAAERALAAAQHDAASVQAVEGRPAPADPAAADPGDPVGAAEVRRLRSRLRAAQEALAAARASARGERREEQVRLRVLLDTVVGAASGLQRELGLPPLDERPADAVAADLAAAAATTPVTAAAVQGRADDDPALLDALLTAPGVHLLVDGYNVTKTGYGEQSLEVQRGRLLAAVGALAARTGVELTVVFDGAGLEGARVPLTVAPRGVRLLFSGPGQTADDVLRELVRAEPRGRPLVVVSSDREVADDVRRDGARPVPSRALLALVERSPR
jgi:predicted RNA-binding protein with PIN domain